MTEQSARGASKSSGGAASRKKLVSIGSNSCSSRWSGLLHSEERAAASLRFSSVLHLTKLATADGRSAGRVLNGRKSQQYTAQGATEEAPGRHPVGVLLCGFVSCGAVGKETRLLAGGVCCSYL